MRIIKSGTPPQKALYRGECRRCGCVFECGSENLDIDAMRRLWEIACRCPECNSIVVVALTARLQSEVDRLKAEAFA